MSYLKSLMKKYDAGKIEHKHYCSVYEEHFEPIKDKVKSVLEIGVQNGGSLKAWRDYFPNAMITGIDIKEKCKKHEGDRIQVIIGDQSDIVFLSGQPCYDIIIDDGGHTMTQQKHSFRLLWQKVIPKGIYVIEDLHTSYWPEFNDTKDCSTIDYLKRKIDDINAWAMNHERAKKHKSEIYNDGIQSMHFYQSLCFIKKL